MTTAKRREDNTMLAAILTNGPIELIDFIVPMWAGVVIGLSATEIGILMAVEMAVSMIARPIAGVLADTRERRYVAAAGALLYALSCVGYALADSAPLAYVAAAIGGIGGALLWVAVRAIVSERLAEDSKVFATLLSAQEAGSWGAFVIGLLALGVIGYPGVFLGCAAACLVAAVSLLLAPGRPAPKPTDRGGLAKVGRRLRPMLFAVALTMMAEAAVALLLILHLQRRFDLEPVQVAYVFLPGAIAMSVAAEHLHGLVVRFGRRRVLMLASLASATFAANLAWAPNPWVIGAFWILSGLAWAAVMPIQQAVIAEASGQHTGRGMGVYESACLLGAMVGTLVAGMLYDSGSWLAACLTIAGVLLIGAVSVPWAVRRLGVVDVPVEVTTPEPAPVGPASPAPSHSSD